MSDWVEKEGYATCLQATEENLNTAGTEVHLIRFQEGKFSHYHKSTTEFFYFTSGNGRVLLDGTEHELLPGSTVMVRPYVRHTFINDHEEQLLEAVLVKTNTCVEDTYRAEEMVLRLPK